MITEKELREKEKVHNKTCTEVWEGLNITFNFLNITEL